MNFITFLIKCCMTCGVFVLVSLSVVSLSNAETLDQLVQEAIKNNPDLAASKARWEQSSHKAPQVGSLMDPVLSFSFSNYPSDDLSDGYYADDRQ